MTKKPPSTFPESLARYWATSEALNASATEADHDRKEEEYMAALHALDATPARAAADFVRKFYAMWGEGGTPNRDRVAMMTAEAKAIIWPAKDAEALEPGILLSNAGCLLSQASGVIEMARHYIEDSCPGAGSSIIEAMFGALELIEQGSKAIDQAGNIMDGRA